MDTNKKINESELEKASGGLIFNASGISGADPNAPWEVINNQNGNVIARFNSKQAAIDFINANYGPNNNPYDSMEIQWNSLQDLRNHPIG